MSFAIGLRFYKVQVFKKLDRTPIPIKGGESKYDLLTFFDIFVKLKIKETEGDDRAWFFTPEETKSIRTLHGIINYGTTGFGSDIKDSKTKEKKYERLATDMEEVPLYYQIWCPLEADFALLALQSFGPRSCIGRIQRAASDEFSKMHEGYRLGFEKLMIEDISTGELGFSPVKQLRFIQRQPPQDKADKYLKGAITQEYEMETVFRSKRRGFLGTHKDISDIILPAQKTGIFTMDGIEYNEIKAEVDFAGKRRVIGILGSMVDSGSIEVSDKVKRGPKGHPTIETICIEVDELMEAFYEAIGGT